MRVLMVDDEEDLVWTISRHLQRSRPDLRFEGLTDPLEAVERIRASPPDLLITDVRMPQLSGLELVATARRHSPSLPVVMITAFSTAEVRLEVMRRGSIEYVEKPFELPALLAAIDRALQQSRGFSGAISLPMLPDLVQVYALARASGVLELAHDGGTGTIWFQRGEIVHSRCGDMVGKDAFFELMGWRGGTFSMRSKGEEPPRCSISASWQELLLEGSQMLDETTHRAREARREPEARSEQNDDEPFPHALFQDPTASPGLVPNTAATATTIPIALVATAAREALKRAVSHWSEVHTQVGAAAEPAVAAVFPVSQGPAWALPATAAEAPAREVRGLLSTLQSLPTTSQAGIFESVGPGVGVGIIWSHAQDLAVVLADVIDDPAAAIWFRFRLAAAARAVLAGSDR